MRKIIRLDVKRNYVVKGQKFEGYKKVGLVDEISSQFIQTPSSEIFYYDLVATLFGHNSVLGQLESLLRENFIPVTVGGGLDNVKKIEECFERGVDRVAINSATFTDPALLQFVSRHYGSQAAIAHVEAKKIGGQWCAMFSAGREIGNISLLDHIKLIQDLGAGEIILSSVDNDGMMNGFPIEVLELIAPHVFAPTVISGGLSSFSLPSGMENFPFIDGIAISKALLLGRV